MKSILHTLCITLFVAAFSSCTKRDVVIPSNPIVGSWILTDAAEGDANAWHPFSTGLENGIFDLYNNGSAVYSDGNVSMQGSWYLLDANSAYFDEYGSYYNGPHQELQLRLSDYYTHSSIDLNFDNVSFYGNGFVATYYNGNYIERYEFSRY